MVHLCVSMLVSVCLSVCVCVITWQKMTRQEDQKHIFNFVQPYVMLVSTPPVLCNAGLHLNGFQPYKGILRHQASMQTSKQEDRFHC